MGGGGGGGAGDGGRAVVTAAASAVAGAVVGAWVYGLWTSRVSRLKDERSATVTGGETLASLGSTHSLLSSLGSTACTSHAALFDDHPFILCIRPLRPRTCVAWEKPHGHCTIFLVDATCTSDETLAAPQHQRHTDYSNFVHLASPQYIHPATCLLMSVLQHVLAHGHLVLVQPA